MGSGRFNGFDPFPERCTPAFPFDLEPLTHMFSYRNPDGPGFLIDADLVGLIPHKDSLLAFGCHGLCDAPGVSPRPKVNPGRTPGARPGRSAVPVVHLDGANCHKPS